MQGISSDVDWEALQEMNVDWSHAQSVLDTCEACGPKPLVKDLRLDLAWRPFVHDDARRSFAYVLPATAGSHFSAEQLRTWFAALHPRQYATDGRAWTTASYRGEELLRRTAWATLDERCRCDYGYSDTWQHRITDTRMLAVLHEITLAVAGACGLPTCLGSGGGQAKAGYATLNSVNLNYYPTGGGVGWHADDEFLFDSLNREATIVSLSLCSAPDEGRRLFQVRLKQSFRGVDEATRREADAELLLGHGDLMTMEGLHQLFYLHSVWPGDSKAHVGHELTRGERINLTWRTIVQHLDGSEECMGMRCPLAGR